MDYFSICLEALCLIGQSIMHIVFVGRFAGKKQRIWHFASYLSLLCIIELICLKYHLSEIPAIGAELLVLYGMSRFAMRNRRSVSLTAAIFAVYISQLSFGIVNSAEEVLFPGMIGKILLYLLVLLATFGSFSVCAGCYAAVLKYLPVTEDSEMPYVGVLLVPGMFIFAAELYILHTSYSGFTSSLLQERAETHGALLFLQILGLGALLCTLYAYRKLCRSMRAQAELRFLNQAVQAQKIYIAEARTRYEQTRAFRHDIKNHLSVLSGLLNSGKLDESKAYLQKLESVSGMLSFPCQTGNPVIDILLGEKLGLAKANGISTEISLLLPGHCKIDDFDLCVIFANALDNAIHACQAVEGEKSIRISGERQGDFYMLVFENTCSDEPLPPAGTGLSNIKSAAEKYRGAMLTEKAGQKFSLSVLLNIL